MVIVLPKRPSRAPLLEAIIRLRDLQPKVRAAVSQLRKTGGGESAANALNEILNTVSHSDAFWLRVAQFDMLSDPKNSYRHGDLFEAADKIDEVMFTIAEVSSQLVGYRSMFPEVDGLPDTLEIGMRADAALVEISNLNEATKKFRNTVERKFKGKDGGGPALSQRANVEPFDVLVESLADLWLHSSRKFSGPELEDFEQVLYAVYERLTEKTELPARRWKKLKPQLRKRTSPPRKK